MDLVTLATLLATLIIIASVLASLELAFTAKLWGAILDALLGVAYVWAALGILIVAYL